MENTIIKKAQNYFIKVLSGMALGLFSSLIIGLIIKQMGLLLHWEFLETIGIFTQHLMSGAIGAGVAYSIGAPPLAVFSSIIAGVLGAGALRFQEGLLILSIGEPVGALVAALAGAEMGRQVAKLKQLEIILIPLTTIIVGGLVGHFIAPAISSFMSGLGIFINFATTQKPFVMGILLSAVMGMVLTLPISSAALGISLGLSGLAAGAATVGCASHMIGFAVASYRDNGFSGFISQGLGTSMLQVPNIVKKPIIALPAILTSIILGPISTLVFKMLGTPVGSGMGTSGLVGQFATLEAMGSSALVPIITMHFFLPALLSFGISEFMRKKRLIRPGDMKLDL
ncbi:MAG: PTS sugar transporter subunit IIC [Tissierellia bacterium]|nr:PTS sugar transporter subunit IIC [Tissierellia bacterium]